MSIAELIALLRELVELLSSEELENASQNWREQRDSLTAQAKNFLATQC